MDFQMNWSLVSSARGRKKQKGVGVKKWPGCCHVRTAKNTRYNRDGTRECMTCRSEAAARARAENKFEGCDHRKTPENTTSNGRCRTCHKNGDEPREAPPCALAEAWPSGGIK